jgi:tetratricopeptide (TPR) repeat protein
MAYRYRGLSRIGIKQFVNAIDDFSKAIVLDSDDLSLYLERGKAYIQIHKFDEAKADFEEVYKKDKNGEDGQLALGYLGDLALNEGEYIQSVEYFSMYCKNEPNNGRGYYMMGMSIIKYLESDEGRVDKKFKYTIKDACDHLNKAVSLGYTFAKEWQVEYCK